MWWALLVYWTIATWSIVEMFRRDGWDITIAGFLIFFLLSGFFFPLCVLNRFASKLDTIILFKRKDQPSSPVPPRGAKQ